MLQTAYHGTPHKFKDFSLEHIGTGEGAQAHGWGLYFAENKDVSEDYRRWLSVGEGGQLFEVDIPENDVLLDEQKVFEAQPEKVKKALEGLGRQAVGELSVGEQNIAVNNDLKDLLGDLIDIPEMPSRTINKFRGKTGKEIYDALSREYGSQSNASKALNAAGIKGISYDGLSDGRSFVVFDDKAIDVLKTFYQPEVNAVSYPNNGRAVGSISPEIARTLRLDKPGAIVLDDIGLQHIEDRHGKEIRGLGFADARAFVDAVLADVNAVYAVNDGGRKYDLVSRAMLPQGRVMVRLEFARTGDFYSVATAGPIKMAQYKKKKPLWESAPHFQSGITDSVENTPRVTGQSGMRQDAADKISLAIGNREVNGAPRARVAFDAAEGGRAVIEFFSAADASSEPQADMPPLEEMRAMMAAAEQGLDRALTELGATMMPVAKGRKQAHANLVKSAYSKESGGVPSNNGFIRQAKKMPVM